MTDITKRRRPDPRLRIITEALSKPGADHSPATILRGLSPLDEYHVAWDIDVRELARHVYTKLYGRPASEASPLEQAEDAKRARDLGAEIGALTSGYEELTSALWYPAQEGDIVHIGHEPLADHLPPFGETYLVYDDKEKGGLVLRLIAWTGTEHAASRYYAPGMVGDPLMEPWMEAGPGALTVVRDGRVVHDGAARRLSP
ncbi:hypothetical protein ACGFIV_00805 [Sphaerisporangium sp. NPDC049003]|uniref:hypothetical protein n=1 Tax=Sphaerisporangium sp. NPDC049003 TaxID=3364517 RepID=UPI003720C810